MMGEIFYRVPYYNEIRSRCMASAGLPSGRLDARGQDCARLVFAIAEVDRNLKLLPFFLLFNLNRNGAAAATGAREVGRSHGPKRTVQRPRGASCFHLLAEQHETAVARL